MLPESGKTAPIKSANYKLRRERRNVVNLRPLLTTYSRKSAKPRTLAGKALDVLVAPPNAGWIKETGRIFNDRVGRQTIYDWCTGKLPFPQWARVLLLIEIEKRMRALEHIRDLLIGK